VHAHQLGVGGQPWHDATNVRVIEQAVGPQELDPELAAQRPLGVVARVVGLEVRSVDESGGRRHRHGC
jgi:hypothetical protein